ncbi:MAG: serine/threonine-protein kinase [Acidobacteriia bacterium]|nr:serine/threonine-protein kinase [Terriglobia bacterium]
MIGRQIGSYQIVSVLGAGGMGEVYRAHDTTLGRDVALKVLPPLFSADPDRLARFEREARVLATLNHPHIGAIYGVEPVDGGRALVLELVEGQTLADRIAHAPIPVAEALAIAQQVADALEAAHEKGIVHRDLKPANIKITPDGVVKVLDFGLAKAAVGAGASPDLSQSPTVTGGGTREGIILGTAAYMSPEQARGKPVDKRADVWAFGCVLFEMLAGRKTFSGDTTSDMIAAILERQPVWDGLPDAAPPAVRRLLRRCLEKDPKRRLRDIGDARLELDDALAGPALDDPARAAKVSMTRRTAIGAMAGAIVGAASTGFVAISRSRGAVPRRSLTQFAITLSEGDIFNASWNKRVAISPDGAQVACNALQRTGGQLLVRSLRDLELKAPEGVGNGIPFFSPDARWLGYMSGDGKGNRTIRKVALTGGAPTTISSLDPGFSGATWADTDAIYFVPDTPAGIARVAAAGGESTEVARIEFDKGERAHKFPHALPRGTAVLFTVATADSESYDDARISVFSTATGQRKVLVEGGTCACYSPSGHLVYARNGSLLAVRFDSERLAVTGRPFTVLDGVLMSRNTGVANFDISRTGDLVYVPGKADEGARTLFLVDRNGRAEKLPLPSRSYLHPRISPDGHKLAIEIEGSSHDVYIYDFASGVLSNITTDGVSHWPVWSPDGKQIGYRSGQMGRFRLWQVPADRSGPAKQVPATGFSQNAESYSPDGHAIAYTVMDPGVPSRIAVVPLGGGQTPQPLENSKYAQGSPKFSPDGRWLAYCSNESGRAQVYVQAFPGPGAKVQVSNDGGTDPVWRRAGGELFFRNGDSMLAVAVSTASGFSAGRPQEIWKGHYSHGMSSSCGAPGLTSSNYDVTADGNRFLMIKDEDQDLATSTRIVVVQGWADELTRLAVKS